MALEHGSELVWWLIGLLPHTKVLIARKNHCLYCRCWALASLCKVSMVLLSADQDEHLVNCNVVVMYHSALPVLLWPILVIEFDGRSTLHLIWFQLTLLPQDGWIGHPALWGNSIGSFNFVITFTVFPSVYHVIICWNMVCMSSSRCYRESIELVHFRCLRRFWLGVHLVTWLLWVRVYGPCKLTWAFCNVPTSSCTAWFATCPCPVRQQESSLAQVSWLGSSVGSGSAFSAPLWPTSRPAC